MIIPEPGQFKQIARELLELADRPLQVEYVMWPEAAFRVPESLADKFAEVRRKTVKPEVVEPEVESQPVKRKPGRPKKEVQ